MGVIFTEMTLLKHARPLLFDSGNTAGNDDGMKDSNGRQTAHPEEFIAGVEISGVF